VPGKTQCRFHGGLSTGAITEDGKARSLSAMRAGRQRWLEETRARKAAGEIERFPGGRKAGAGWVTPRPQVLEVPNKIDYVDLKSCCERAQCAQRRRFKTPFKLTDIRPVQVAAISEFFLRHTRHVPLGLQP
jgi:hypothetical protein